MVNRLITMLEKMTDDCGGYNKNELLEALIEIDSLAELENPKKIISDLVTLWLFELRSKGEIGKKSFHTVIYGPSGVGKSLFAKCLAKVFRSFSNNRLKSKQTVGFYLEELISNFEGRAIPTEVVKNYWVKIKQAFDSGIPIIKNQNVIPEIIYCGRNELIGAYSGWTTDKTRKYLTEHSGHYLIIEEAYILCTSTTDGYGKEALTEISQFMDKSDSPIFIFTGYEDQIKEYLFKIQPGLVRRIDMVFKIDAYSHTGLNQIFNTQIEQDGWKLGESVNSLAFFESHIHHFPHFGGDTVKLAYSCKIAASVRIMTGSTNVDELIISLEDLEVGMEKYLSISVLDF